MNLRSPPVLKTLGLFLLGTAPLTWLAWARLGLPPLAAWLSSVNLSVFGLWWLDKHQARRAGFRIPEWTLHLVALAGAVPGSIAAMRLLRHKTQKPSFKLLYAVFAVLQLALLAWSLGWIGADAPAG